ncbi:hypothetical protein SAMN05216455_10234 [Segatella bryantii]|uniref:hypothetical protein n=1 Tax=Segatella bryantii TaxID=77095 RepID=UPI000894C234|nr:hypothetical protein [Segatella bryantii]SDZ94935.1 hypothetical protein SAMN05216455_10234 [Segatella bryantii]
MKIRKQTGYVVHAPLSYAFEVKELGGSYIQKYDTISGAFIPNRELTPYLLQPCLTITDPDGNIPAGEYTSRLVNVRWVVRGWLQGVAETLAEGTDYTIDSNTHALTFSHNVAVDELVHIEFCADYVNNVRGEAQSFKWSKDLATVGEAQWNVSLTVDVPSKVDLSPFKNRGQFNIFAQLFNGDGELSDSACVYLWQRFNGTQWVDIDGEEDAFYVAGKNAKGITIDQDYLQHEILRIVAYPVDKPSEQRSATMLLRRWYGQWEESIDLMQGKYVFTSDTIASGEVKVMNRQGNIASPQRYFEIEIFFAHGNSQWQSVAYGTKATVQRSDMAQKEPKFGVLCRELSAFQPIELPDGSVLTDEGNAVLMAQFPTSDREV